MEASSAPPPRVIGKRPRASRFLRLLITITAVIHVPFAVAFGEGLHRWASLDYRIAWPVAGVLAVFGVYLFLGRAKNIMNCNTPLWWGMRWVAATNAESPDLVVVTGDMVTSGTYFHDDIAALVGSLRGKDGVVVSMGNHDYFGDGEPLISLLIQKGVEVLRNAGQVIERDDGKMYLAAIDDTWTKRADMDRALEGRPEGMPTVLLAHDPDRFPQAAKKGVSLVLAGHTHGGQIAVPFIERHINASKLAHKFHIGIYEDGPSRLHVHPGLGTTGPPIRLGVAPAVVFLRLRAV